MSYEGYPKSLPESEYPYNISLLIKETKTPRVPTIYVSKFPPGFMLQPYFLFSMLKASVDLPQLLWLYSQIHHIQFFFLSRTKTPPLDILKLLVAALINQYDKVTFVRLDKDGSIARLSEFMKICNNINIIFQTVVGDTY